LSRYTGEGESSAKAPGITPKKARQIDFPSCLPRQFEYLFNSCGAGCLEQGIKTIGEDTIRLGLTIEDGLMIAVGSLSGDTPEQQYVVRAGQASANSLQAGTTNSPNGYGFSVQTAPVLSPNQLAAGAPNISRYGSYSFSTVMQLESIPGVEVSFPTPGGGLYHGTVTLPYPPPPGIFGAISSQFMQVTPNPYKSP